MGTDNVKFMAAIGTVVMGEFYGAIFGGIAVIIVLFAKKNLLPTLKKIFFALLSLITFRTPKSLKFDETKSGYLPYTVFLSLSECSFTG